MRVVPMQRATLAALAGDWTDAERLLGEASETYRRSRQATGTVAGTIALRCLRMAQGRRGGGEHRGGGRRPRRRPAAQRGRSP
jgi:hypothetical protein